MTEQPCPDHLSAEAREWWQKIVTGWELDESALLILRQALESFDRLVEVQKQIREDGLTVRNYKTGATSAHPLLRVEKESRNLLLRAWRQLGLDMDPPGPIGRPPGGRRT